MTADVHEIDRSSFLPILLAGNEYLLPWKYIGHPTEGDHRNYRNYADNGDYIAYFDPRKRELCEAGAIELARMATPFHPTLIVTTESSKSGPMVQRAQDLLQESNGGQVDIVTFAKMKLEDINESENNEAIGYYAQYSPITAAGRRIAMVVSHDNVNALRQHAVEGKAVFMDDVISTGETERAAQRLVAAACRALVNIPLQLPIPTIAVMRECLIGKDGKMQESSGQEGIYYAVRTPVVPGTVARMPQGYSSEPFIARTYTQSEQEYLQNIANNQNLTEQLRFDARLALAGMLDIHPQGLGYMNNFHH